MKNPKLNDNQIIKPEIPQETPKKQKKQTLEQILKLEIAAELGLFQDVEKNGWGSLTSAQAGKIGGLVNQRKKKLLLEKSNQEKQD